MKNFIQLLSLISILLLSAYNANATHIQGATIEWQEQKKDYYQIKVQVVKDCNGAELKESSITVVTANGREDIKISFTKGKDITPLCKHQKSLCEDPNSAFKYGFVLYTAYAYIDLSKQRRANDCEVSILYSYCCRNNSITTGPKNSNLYIEAKMNICDSTVLDHSPSFFENGIDLIIGQGNKSTLSFAAADADGDSLVYSMISPLTGAGNTASWQTPYSETKPLYYLGFPNESYPFPRGFNFDNQTGQMKFMAMKPEVSVLTVKVDEYRKGKWIGSVIKEQNIFVIKTPNNSTPVISGINNTVPHDSNLAVSVCEGTKLEFEIATSDNDKADSVKLAVETMIPGLKWAIVDSSAQLQKVRFTWTPQKGQASKTPYQIEVKATDDACPISTSSTVVFRITVNPTQHVSSQVIDTNICVSNENELVYLGDQHAGVKGIWQGDEIQNDDQGAYLSGIGTYKVNFVIEKPYSCQSILNKNITIKKADSTLLSIASDTICLSGILLYTPKSNATLNSIVGDAVNGTKIEFTSKNYGINEYVGYSTNSDGCVSEDTFTIKVNPLPLANFMAGTTNGTAPASIQFINLSSNASSYNWEFGNGDTSKLENPKYTYSKPGVYTVSLKVSGEDGLCEDTLSFWKYIIVDQTVGFNEFNDGVTVYPNPTMHNLYINGAAGKNIQIYNSIGKLMKTVEITSSNYQLNVSTMPQGTYFYAITGKEVLTYGKFMVR